MTALKNLALGILVWQLLGISAQAAPMSGTTGNWAWWWSSDPSTVASQWTPNQLATAFYGPSGSSTASSQTSQNTQVFSAATSAVASPPPVSYSSSSVATTTTSTPMVNAFLNLGNGPYPLASQITTGNAQPWYDSSQISSFFGGQPNSQQIAAFDSTILQRVQQTFQQSGVNISLTTDPTVLAAHTLSLVSNTGSNTVPGVIGMTQIGASGFSFIDQIAKSAQSLDQLEWIVAHNISHELMLSFGVGENYDQTGNYIDARNANWSMMTDPSATFSSAAAQAIQAALANQQTATSGTLGAQEIVQPVPEPTTILVWTFGLSAAFFLRRKLIVAR
ncbi:MAG: PEP-CTERM sorting domain-containing protein [Isosphaeraceae bacterium]